jgi:hypothetical protein
VTPDPLPPDLLALERALAARPRPEPSAGLRDRVLTAAERERPGPRTGPERRDFVRFAAATAAAALLAINLSASLANNTDWHLSARADGPAVADVAGRLRELTPDVSEREAVRQALLLRAAAGLTPAPVPAPPADRTLWHKEPDRWDTR